MASIEQIFESLRDSAESGPEGFGELQHNEKHSQDEIERFTIAEARRPQPARRAAGVAHGLRRAGGCSAAQSGSPLSAP